MMQRRAFLQSIAALGAASSLPFIASHSWALSAQSVSVDSLPKLEGELTLYLGRGEGGLYEDVLKAIQDRNPKFKLNIRRGQTAALANAIVAESKAGIHRADLFWAVDSGAIGMIANEGLAKPLPALITGSLLPEFQFPNWAPVSGRVRTLPYNPQRVSADKIPNNILDLPDSDLSIAWAPAYASFQSFVTAMRLLIGDDKTSVWLQKMSKKSKRYAGELGVVMAVERGEVDLGLANHYYTLRLKSGKPDANVDLAFTKNDAGCLVNTSGIVSLTDNKTAFDFIRYLHTTEVQSYLAGQAYEVPLVNNVETPKGLPAMQDLAPPKIDLTQLADLRPTLDLMRKAGVL